MQIHDEMTTMLFFHCVTPDNSDLGLSFISEGDIEGYFISVISWPRRARASILVSPRLPAFFIARRVGVVIIG